MKKLISLILAISLLLLSLGLTACGEPADDGTTDVEGGGENEGGNEGGTGDAPDASLELIKDGVANFNIIYSMYADSEVRSTIDFWIDQLAFHGVEVKSYTDSSVSKMQDCEILIGESLIQRNDYAVDVHDFGEKGYVIKVVDEKVVICGGSVDSTLEAMTLFLEEYLGVNIATVEVGDVSVAKTLFVEKVQDDYPIKDVTVGGESIRGAYIRAQRTNAGEYAAAQVLQAALYTNSGIWLKIQSPADDTGKKIQLNLVDDEGDEGFRVFVNNGTLTVNAEYDGTFERGMNDFIADAITNATGTVDFANDYSFVTDTSFVRYSDFGAAGTGLIDDFDEIIATHEFANQYGLRVEADEGATYYISEGQRTADIKTPVDWKDATFIIDDRNLTQQNGGKNRLFTVTSYNATYNLKVPEGMKLSKDATNVGLTFDTDVMLKIINQNKRVFIRTGNFTAQSQDCSDVVIVHPNGDIDESTPLVFDYDEITSIQVISMIDEPMTINGGTFIHYPNHQARSGGYFRRNIVVYRSNTTLYGVKMLLEKEPDPTDESQSSSPYEGFFSANNACNVTFDSCVLSGRYAYVYQFNGSNKRTGTYATNSEHSINTTWQNCTQANDIHDTNRWGVMGSGGSKNLKWENCVLSRFDIHTGAHNIYLKDCEIGEVINLIGWGTAYLENVKVSGAYNQYFIRLREDYGAIWDGDVIIKNCELVLKDGLTAAYVFRADWNSHDYGYQVALPNVDIDGFKVTYQNGKDFTGTLSVFRKISGYSTDIRKDVTNPLKAPLTVTVKGVSYTLKLVETTNCEIIFTDTTFTVIKDE
ncbi:MAG: hypothetical protein IJY65_02735 [Clostridia bacterium]|nr:hypothetical protein [Clostridia bacterium]